MGLSGNIRDYIMDLIPNRTGWNLMFFGENGWEMAMTTKIPQEYIVMWFKRPR